MADNVRNEVERMLSEITGGPVIVSREQEEDIYGEKSAFERGGRLPAFYRAEVDAIRLDMRSMQQIADAYKVSITTIARVKQRGRFAGIPYIPRDEVDRREAYPEGETRAPQMKDFVVPKTGRRGRPFANGRAALTDAEMASVLHDPRHPRDVAAHWGLATSYVISLRRRHGIAQRGPLSEAVKQMIRDDPREPEVLAVIYKLPAKVIRHMKEYGSGEPDTGSV